MAKQFLNGSNIISRFQQVCREAMSERMTSGMLRNSGRNDGFVEGPLDNGWVTKEAARHT